ncbi:uncharacterized protein LOC129988699 [Argiope bruennichi]|uniref:uncharacterized protein LOC129988699 n=1 Tax=Argiope bruennichi TaxID=94029 RepID=UPI0024947F5E|nr:uncharacterized protein LOC129988699 [Argiope bruennichi]
MLLMPITYGNRLNSDDPPSISFQNSTIKVVSSFRYLGVIWDSKLTFTEHFRHARRKSDLLMYKLNTVANRFFSRHHHLYRGIYTGAFEPYVLLGYGAWGHHLKFKQLVQKTQVKFDDTYLDPELYEPTLNPYDQHPSEWFTFPFQKNPPSGDGIEIFTDGSKIGDRAGSAIACFYFGKLIYVDSHRLDDHSTVFQAEAYAFFMALDYIDQINSWSKVSIYSDSLSLLTALASPKRKSWMLKQIADKIKAVNSNRRLSLHWVKAHIGVEGNEVADKQAKYGTEKDSIDSHVPRSHGTLRADIWRCILAEWQNEWASSSKGPQTHKYFPNVSTKMKSFHPFLIQFLSGHGRFPYYFNKFGITNDPLCDCGKVGTPDHYIYECIHTHLLRQKIKNAQDKDHLLKDPHNLHVIHQIIAWINDHIPRL